MSLQASGSVERLTARVAQIETSNAILSAIVATILLAGVLVVGAAMVPHLGRTTGVQHSLTSCAPAKVAIQPCRPQRPKPAPRIVTA